MRLSTPSPPRLLLISFLVLIGFGTLLLKLPAATPDDAPIGWVDALFTATSAACVTGLVVRDTGTAFTPFGQGVILALIQLGGLGVMTFSLFLFGLFRQRLPVVYRPLMEQTLSSLAGRELLPLLRLVLLFTFGTEAVGFVALLVRWWPEMEPGEAVWAALFHSVSAFCNAGFSLWADSLSAWRGDAWVNLVVMGLIVLGGIGFFVVHDLLRQARRFRFAALRRLSVHSKLALATSLVLILLGAMFFWVLEAPRTLFGLPISEQILASLFHSVTTRTAGFNTVDVGALAPATLFGMTILMFIGGSPGSTAGGIKTTTVAVLVAAMWSRFDRRLRVNVFHRTLTERTVANTLAIFLGAAVVGVAGLFVLLLAEAPEQPILGEEAVFLNHFFETVSALATVGLSTGVTDELSAEGRLIVTILMYVGRLGPLTVAAALGSSQPIDDWRYPETEVVVG